MLFSLIAFSQDTTTKSWTFHKNIRYWGKWQTHATHAGVKMPGHIRAFRKSTTALPITFDTITDNPLRHGATYVSLQTQTAYRNKIFLFADVYGEHRGVSYGLYNQNNTVLYPVMRIEAKDTVSVFSMPFEVSGKVGQFLDERLDEGLQIYNIDVQGMQLRTAFKNYELQYTIYGDLNNGIGLNIDDLEVFSFQRKLSNGKDRIGISWVLARPPFYPLKNFYNLNLFGRKSFGQTSIYTQLAFRPFRLDPGFQASPTDKAAFLLGMSTRKTGKLFRHQMRAELRYYGWQFNFIYQDVGTRYRQPANDMYEMYANTVGKYLYPLRKFATPFGQWAVFTEYSGYTILAASLQGNAAYRLSSKFEAALEYDLNLIQSKLHNIFYLAPGEARTTAFLYPFFEPGIRYTPAENIKASLFFPIRP